jgi:hypothetical protein
MTAVEFLQEKIIHNFILVGMGEISPKKAVKRLAEHIEQAKRMEQTQIDKAYQDGFMEGDRQAHFLES